jgi:hypothetical protein
VGGAQIIHYPRKNQERPGGATEGEEKKEVSEEALGVEKSPFEKQLEPLTELPTPEKKTQDESVIDLRKK